MSESIRPRGKKRALDAVPTRWIAIALVLLLGACVVAPKRDARRPLKASDLMHTVVKVNRDALSTGLATRPAATTDWEKLRAHAAVLNECSYILMQNGRPEDEAWTLAASETLRRGSLDVVRAAERQDYDSAQRGLHALNESCVSCHKECDS